MALRLARLREVAKPARIAGKLVRSLVVLAVAGHLLLFIVVFLASLVLLNHTPRYTALMLYRRVTAHQVSQPIRFVPLHRIPAAMRLMATRLEDYRFYEHAGVDFGALRDAWRINEEIGRTAVGGSTIPMQLARNLFLTPRKTYFRKYVESLIALEMDLILPKNRILELYLNCIEWGRGVFGIGNATLYYYKTGVGGLDLDQERRLITIITNPLRFNVKTLSRSRQMAERYAYLVSRFPDPAALPTQAELSASGPVAPVPDAPQAEASTEAGAAPADTGSAVTAPEGSAPAGATPADTAPAATAAPPNAGTSPAPVAETAAPPAGSPSPSP
ncbi:MAG TPA: transglycosylase domain-containing protein [Spirochaetia bacterium]